SLAAAAVVDPHRVQEVGDLPAVRADVLDRRRPDAAGDARHAFEPTEAGLDGPGHERVPVLARGNLDAHPLDTVDLRPLDPLALRADPDGGAVEPAVGDHQVRAATEQQHRLTGGVPLGHRGDEFVVGLGLEHGFRRAAEPQCRVISQGCGHDQQGNLPPMARPLQHSTEFSYPVDKVLATIAEDAAICARLDAIGGHEAELLSHQKRQNGYRYTLRQGIPADNLPSIVRKIYSGDLIVKREQEWVIGGDGTVTGTGGARSAERRVGKGGGARW